MQQWHEVAESSLARHFVKRRNANHSRGDSSQNDASGHDGQESVLQGWRDCSLNRKRGRQGAHNSSCRDAVHGKLRSFESIQIKLTHESLYTYKTYFDFGLNCVSRAS